MSKLSSTILDLIIYGCSEGDEANRRIGGWTIDDIHERTGADREEIRKVILRLFELDKIERYGSYWFWKG